MAQLANTFEGGSNGATITTAGSGGASGDAFGGVASTGTGTYTTTSPLVGSLSGLMAAGVTTDTPFLTWLSSWTAVAEVWSRAYVKMDALPSPSTRILQFRESPATGTSGCDVSFTSAGNIALRAPTTIRYTSTKAFAAGEAFRIEMHVISAATSGTIECRLFWGANINGTTADEAFGGLLAASDTGNGLVGGMAFGIIAAPGVVMNQTLDALVLNDTGWPGPSVSTTVPAAVSNLAGTAGNTQVPLTWTAPADGGSAITDYVVQYRIAP